MFGLEPVASHNGVHHGMNFLPNVHEQLLHLGFQGEVRQFCDGPCDPE